MPLSLSRVKTALKNWSMYSSLVPEHEVQAGASASVSKIYGPTVHVNPATVSTYNAEIEHTIDHFAGLVSQGVHRHPARLEEVIDQEANRLYTFMEEMDRSLGDGSVAQHRPALLPRAEWVPMAKQELSALVSHFERAGSVSQEDASTHTREESTRHPSASAAAFTAKHAVEGISASTDPVALLTKMAIVMSGVSSAPSHDAHPEDSAMHASPFIVN